MIPYRTLLSIAFVLALLTCGALPSCAGKAADPGEVLDAQPSQNALANASGSRTDMTEKPESLTIGTWAATGISFVVAAEGVSIELPCANAIIGLRPKLNRKGEFDVVGQYNQEGPGAMTDDDARGVADPGGESTNGNVRFRGKVDGSKMSLTISFEKSGKKIGSYGLEFGKHSRLIKCM